MSKADQIVLDRRLRPIYDALDSNNPKRALQEAEKVLKKHPNTTCAKVLRALCLIRSERLSEAMSIIDVLDVPGARHDESTLGAFVHCYKEATVPERINTLYERAIEVDPSEHNLTQLFMSYARTKQYKKQQLIGMRLFKDFAHTPYYFWSVMAVVMQAMETPALAKKMLYPLAEKMFQTQIKKTGYTTKSGAEVELFSLILEGMGRWKEQYELLTSPQALHVGLPVQFMNEKRVELLLKEKRYEAAKMLIDQELINFPDSWSMWNKMFDMTLAVIDEKVSNNETAEAQKAMNDLVDLIDVLTADGECKTRGPYMARLELIKRLADSQHLPIKEALGTITIGEPVELMGEYIKKFYAKPSCFNDVVMFMSLLNGVQKDLLNSVLTSWISDIFRVDDDPESPNEDKVWAIIVYERLRRVMGFWSKETTKKKRQHVQQLIAQIAQPGRTELTMGALCQLAICPLWTAWRTEDDPNCFYEQILLLEYVASHNASDPNCKLALIRAYSEIGNTARVTALAKMLDIKAVQNDTLGYLTFPTFELAGRFNLAIIANTQLSLIYDQAEKEIMECLVTAYKNGKFAQIPRLVALSERMKKSSQAVACDVLNRYLSSLFVIDDLDETITTCYGDDDPIDWSGLIDNRDLDLIPSTEEPGYEKLVTEMKMRTHHEFVDISRLRHVLCRALSTIGRVTRVGVPAQKARNEMKEAISIFSAHIEYCQREYPSFSVPSRLLQSPAPMRLSQWVHSGGPAIIRRFLNATQQVVDVIDSGSVPSVSLLGTTEELNGELAKLVDVYGEERVQDRPFWLQDPICAASRVLQTLASLQITLSLIERVYVRKASNEEYKTEKSTNKKKAAKTHEEEVKPVFVTHCAALIGEVKSAAKKLNGCLTLLAKKVGGEDVLPENVADDLGGATLVLETLRPVVDSRIRRSYVMALEDMQTTISTRF